MFTIYNTDEDIYRGLKAGAKWQRVTITERSPWLVFWQTHPKVVSHTDPFVERTADPIARPENTDAS